jgi:hypothetical protein
MRARTRKCYVLGKLQVYHAWELRRARADQ